MTVMREKAGLMFRAGINAKAPRVPHPTLAAANQVDLVSLLVFNNSSSIISSYAIETG